MQISIKLKRKLKQNDLTLSCTLHLEKNYIFSLLRIDYDKKLYISYQFFRNDLRWILYESSDFHFLTFKRNSNCVVFLENRSNNTQTLQCFTSLCSSDNQGHFASLIPVKIIWFCIYHIWRSSKLLITVIVFL